MDLGAGLRGFRKSLIPLGFEFRTVQHLAIRYADYATAGRHLYEEDVVAVCWLLCSFRRKRRETELLDL